MLTASSQVRWRGPGTRPVVVLTEALESAVERALSSGLRDIAAQGKVFMAKVCARSGDPDGAKVLLDEAGELGAVVTAGLR